jgi:Polyketide cyclase / dehydrase and lipid transport
MLVLSGPSAQAFGIHRSDASYANKQYRYELDVTLDAPIEQVEAVLRDYEHYPQLDTRILQARVLERPTANVVVLETMLRACFGPFCRNVRRVERVEEMQHALTAITDAARSDVKFGETYTQLSAAAEGGTRVRYRTSITPGFWVPIFGGRRWMLSTLEDATSDLFMNVEMKAREMPQAQPQE